MPAKRIREMSAEQRGLINWSWEEYRKPPGATGKSAPSTRTERRKT